MERNCKIRSKRDERIYATTILHDKYDIRVCVITFWSLHTFRFQNLPHLNAGKLEIQENNSGIAFN